MRFKNTKRLERYRTDWTRWFAWYPVSIDDKIVWLETVERYFNSQTSYVSDSKAYVENGIVPPDYFQPVITEWHYRNLA